MLIVHNKIISNLIKISYAVEDIDRLFSFLHEKGTFTFNPLHNGLFPAANLAKESAYTGYSDVWIRDNVYVAYAHYVNKQFHTASRNVKNLAKYFIKYKWRFEQIISRDSDYSEPMNRPNVRFDGETLSEIDQNWAHAQNDALGYFVWFLSKLSRHGHVVLSDDEKELLTLFALYFKTIRYWEDEDSGHWEETRKIEASSIGVAVSGLEELRALLMEKGDHKFSHKGKALTVDYVDELIELGRQSLQQILPAECIQPDPSKNRRYDAALLFLIFPMGILEEATAAHILSDVEKTLQGDYGIKRYLGDSFWAADYKKKLAAADRTKDYSNNLSERDRFLIPGEEAQWCIFDPIISIICGLRYEKYGERMDLRLQTHYFNRSLGQLTHENNRFGGLRCPELYYREEGKYVPNDTVPLLWTQANLWMAFKYMRDSLV